MKINSKPYGFSLIELMVSMALSLIIILGFIQSMMIIKTIYQKHEALSVIQENARIIHMLLGRYILQAGNMGCNRMSDEMLVYVGENINAKRLGLIPFQALSLFKEVDKLSRKPNGDVLWIVRVVQNHSKSKDNQVLVSSDCRHVDFVMPEELAKRHYLENRKIGRLHSTLFYIAKTNRLDDTNQPIYALYTTNLNGKTQERIEGVQSFEVTLADKTVNVKIGLRALNTPYHREFTWIWPFLPNEV